MTSSSLTKDYRFHKESSLLIGDTPKISSDCSNINCSDMSNICLKVRLFPVFLMECKCSELFFPMNTDAFQCRRHKHSPNQRKFVDVCIACSEEWPNIFRNRSVTQCKNDRDFSERSDSVAVSESISSSMANLSVSWANGCPPTGLPVLASNISPDFHCWEDQFLSALHSE